MQVPSLLVDDSPGAGRGAFDRETIMAGQTHHVLRLEVIRVKIELAVSIREEVNRCTDPHRLGIVAAPRGFGDFLVREVRKFENPDPRSRAAAVILPLAEPLTKGVYARYAPSGETAPMSPVGTGSACGTPPLTLIVKNCECLCEKTCAGK